MGSAVNRLEEVRGWWLLLGRFQVGVFLLARL